jgi:hypothetical protein
MAMEKSSAATGPRSKPSPGSMAPPMKAIDGFAAIQKDVEAFAEEEGRRPGCWSSRWARTGMTAGPR